MKRRELIFSALLMAALLATNAFAASSPTLLPKVFAGWTQSSAARSSNDPAAADATNAALLKEDGFTNFEEADYGRPGRKITVQAIHFADASGAYSAFTTYKTPEMETIDMGAKSSESLGAALSDRVLFYRQNILVQVKLDRMTAMTAGEMRELASLLPQVSGAAKNLPTLPTYLPKQSYVKNSAKYVMGPVGLAAIGCPIPDQTIGFQQKAEIVTGNYNSSRGTATLAIISYPTPAIAGEHLRAIEALNQNPPAGSSSSFAPPFTVKRTGPIVVLTAGQLSSDDAKTLLGSVNYDADITWNQNTHVDKNDNVVGLLSNIIVLTAILIGLCLVAGVAFGGVRIVLKKLYPGRVFDRERDMGIIQLNIRE